MEMNLSLKCAFRFTVFSSLLLTAIYVPAQENKRLLDWLEPSAPDNIQLVSEGLAKSFVPSEIRALEVVEVKVAGKPISIGHDFFADDNWIGSLSFRLRNISQKPILSIRLTLNLPETKKEESSLGFSLEYGKELSPGKRAEASHSILPGQEVELKFTEARYQGYVDYITKTSLLTSFKKVIIGNVLVYFDDETFWLGGKLPVHR
jgi:hypothetical protein